MQIKKLPTLTALRFYAAAAVVTYHFAQEPISGAPGWLQAINRHGYVGVSFFFVLSGFVLTYTYHARLDGSRRSRREFWAARVARIYPLYLFSLLLGLPLYVTSLAARSSPMVAVAKGVFQGTFVVTMLQAWNPLALGVWNFAAWSLSVEAMFYLVFPWLLPYLRSRSSRQLWTLASAAWALSQVVPFAVALAERRTGLPLSQGLAGFAVRYDPLLHLPQFVIGAATCLLWQRWLADPGRATATATRGANLVAVGAIAAVLVILAADPGVPMAAFNNGLLAPLIAVILFAAATADYRGGPLLGNAPSVLLGDASYALYILQVPLRGIAAALLAVKVFTIREFCGYFAALLLASIASYLWFEVPARRYVAALLARPASRAAATTATAAA